MVWRHVSVVVVGAWAPVCLLEISSIVPWLPRGIQRVFWGFLASKFASGLFFARPFKSRDVVVQGNGKNALDGLKIFIGALFFHAMPFKPTPPTTFSKRHTHVTWNVSTSIESSINQILHTWVVTIFGRGKRFNYLLRFAELKLFYCSLFIRKGVSVNEIQSTINAPAKTGFN